MLERLRSRAKTTSPESAPEFAHQSLARRLLGLVFGYDFFVSYSWSDGGEYAAALARRLKANGFEVFLDRDDYASGDDWKTVGAWKLKRTGQLVLVGSPAALRSEPVVREVRIFSGTGRRILPIDFDGTLEWKSDDAPLARYLPAEILRIREPAIALKTGPSDQVVATIRRSFNLVRQDKKRVNALLVVALVLLVLAAAAASLAVVATIARNTAQEQRDRAKRALDQVTASANARVMALAERAEAEASTQHEIKTAARADAGAAPDPDRAAGLIALSGRYFDSRDYAAAINAAQTALTLLGAADDAALSGPDHRLMRANAYERIALAEARLARFKDAEKHLATSLDLIKTLAGASPQDAQLRERLAATLVNMSQVRIANGEFDDAQRDLQQAIELRAAAPDLKTSPDAIRLLALTHNRMAELRLARQQYDDAMDSSEHSSTMLERLRTDKPAASVLRELSAAYDIRARAIDAAGHSDLALVWRDKDLAIVKQLAGSDPDNIEWRHDLALSLEARGGLLDKLRQPDAALDAYGQAIAILEALPAQSRIPPDWLRDTARTIGERGALLKLRGRTAEAVEDFRRKLALLERLAASALDTVTDNDLENAYRQAREALLEADRTAEALETAEQQLFAISVAANRDTRDFTRLAQVLSSVCWTAILARDTPRAELAGREAVALDRKNDGARLNYAHALMFSGNLAAARKIYLDGPGAGEARAAKWRESIRKDFKVLAANNLRHPLMDEIERDIPP